MGDRSNPMNFGPEWLRNNLSGERTGHGNSSASGLPTSQPHRPVTSAAPAPTTSAAPNVSKVLLAKLRYGREEMLALYDQHTAEAPHELQSIELLFHTRGKPPYALNINFEEDNRDSNLRNHPTVSVVNAPERYGQGRGRGAGGPAPRVAPVEGRGRSRLSYMRQNTGGPSDTYRLPEWQRSLSYLGTPDDYPNPTRGLWNNGTNVTTPGIRPNVDLAYRKPRQQSNTNWRQQQNREDSEEWRSYDTNRRGGHNVPEKWEREWPERTPQEKGWTNRRQWNADTSDDTLPEWAVENSEACGGTFDSSGAFHGYSNDDSNIPKAQDSAYPIARSHTQGSLSQEFKRFAKRRFDATEVKFKKPVDKASEKTANPMSAAYVASFVSRGKVSELVANRSKLATAEEPQQQIEPRKESPDEQEKAAANAVSRSDDKSNVNSHTNINGNPPQQRMEMLNRKEEEDAAGDKFKTVVMSRYNDYLRHQHQKTGTSRSNTSNLMGMLLKNHNEEIEKQKQDKQQETKLVEDMLDMHLSEEIQAQLLNSTTQTDGIPDVNSISQIPNPGMKMGMNNPMMKPGIGINQPGPTILNAADTNMSQPIGITNSTLNASLGLPIGDMNMPMPTTSRPLNPRMMLKADMDRRAQSGQMQLGGLQSRMPVSMQTNMQTSAMNPNMQSMPLQSGMQQVSNMPANSFQTGMPANMQGMMQASAMNNNNMHSTPGVPAYQIGNNSLFMRNPPNTMQSAGDMNHGQQNMYQLHDHGLQQSSSQSSFDAASIYANMMHPPPVPLASVPLNQQWYYEDPEKIIQGPFSSQEMFSWYRAGFFTPSLMVRRACESVLRPLSSYGMLPFGPVDMLPPHQYMPGGYELHPLHGYHGMNPHGLRPELEALWHQPTDNDLDWLDQQMASSDDTETKARNISNYYWDKPSGMAGSLMPEGLPKEMKTEDEILAQIRADQSEAVAQNLTFMPDAVSPEEAFTAGTNIAPNLEELQKLIGNDIRVGSAPVPESTAPVKLAAANASAGPISPRPIVTDKPCEKTSKADPVSDANVKQQFAAKVAEVKTSKQPKSDDKSKIKETPKSKTKKSKEEKKEDSPEIKKDEKKITEKRSDEPSPPKSKQDKASKKELEKEKKEWLKDGFTIVKGAEKKDSKKKEKEEARAVEEAEKKRKEEEKRALEAEMNRTPEPVTRRQQLVQGQSRQAQPAEQVPKKAPWSAQSSREGLALADIQRLEREKKLEQMKEQQQMMQTIALQQQAANAQKEQQEMQSGQVGWAKKKQPNNSPPGQSMAEIQAEARKQAAAMAVAAAAARVEVAVTPPPVNIVSWGATNGGGFWDTPSPGEPPAPVATPKPAEPKPKKKVTVVAPPKKEISPSTDFNTWCSSVLSNWKDAANIDIPTFVAFLRDIESPYEVKDYVKCYLGDTKEANDFARQFLERRSRLLRVGMVTPSDDLCSPAAALTPRTNSGSDNTEVKSKANKKTKKNKMLKVDARILGFSVTASEDRINIGDIDRV